jgi:hypothetical protein
LIADLRASQPPPTDGSEPPVLGCATKIDMEKRRGGSVPSG